MRAMPLTIGKSASKSSTKVGPGTKAKAPPKASTAPSKAQTKPAAALPKTIKDPTPKAPTKSAAVRGRPPKSEADKRAERDERLKKALGGGAAATKQPAKDTKAAKAAKAEKATSVVTETPVFGGGKTASLPAPVEAAPLAPGQIRDSSLADLIASAVVIDPNPTRRLLITPDLAKSFLLRNKTNRPLSITHVQFLAREIVRNDWQEANGDTIKFDPAGNLIDGQHRLSAIVLADRAVYCDVKFDVPAEAQHTLDTGRKRSISDQLALRGEGYATTLAATVRWTLVVSRKDTSYRATTPEVINFIERNPEIRGSNSYVHSGKHPKGTVTTLLAAVHYIATQALKEGEKANRFVEVFRKGNQAYENDPAHKLREETIELKANRNAVVTARTQMENLIHVWNLHRKDKAPRLWKPKGPAFIEGYDPAVLGIDIHDSIPTKPMMLETGKEIPVRA